MNHSMKQVSLPDLPDELLITIGVMLCKTDPKSVLNLACVNLDMDEFYGDFAQSIKTKLILLNKYHFQCK